MEITHFDEEFFYCSHHFYKGDKLMAQGTSKALVISKSLSLTPQYMLDAVAEYQAKKYPETVSD